MKNAIKLVVAAMLVACAGSAFAQNSTSATGYAQGNVISPITITPRASGVNFGNIVGGPAGNVTEANGTSNFSNVQNEPGSNNGTVGDALFSVHGESGVQYAWSVSHTTMNSAGLPAGVTLTQVTIDPNESDPATVITTPTATPGVGGTDATGTGTLNGLSGVELAFGGMLHFAPGVSYRGDFSGLSNFQVIVGYN